ncbi:MAG: hypothetical protein HYV95_01530 [Opitutae bacterium]|nr:hypothetical protein [Opitutae bacterium]
MNATPQTPAAPRRRIWLWVLGLCLAPFLLLGIAVASFLTLDRDAATLRKHVMAATDADWSTKVQLSVGSLTLGTVRQCLWFVHDQNVGDARLALKAVRHASVGVYERRGDETKWSREELFVDTDKAMQKRGWSRLVGVADHGDTVLVYTPDNLDPDDPVDVCIAVINDRDLVVVSATLDAKALSRLVEKKAGEDIRRSLHIARH